MTKTAKVFVFLMIAFRPSASQLKHNGGQTLLRHRDARAACRFEAPLAQAGP